MLGEAGLYQACLAQELLHGTEHSNYLHSARLRQSVGVPELHTAQNKRNSLNS